MSTKVGLALLQIFYALSSLILPKMRIGTRPTRIANKKRLDEKTKRGQIKVLRKYIRED